ncbi:MAG: KOW motif-containing protein, partial [Bacilli bacterium]|nr:KOW motif-containing protein [Bacilli bacterium]
MMGIVDEDMYKRYEIGDRVKVLNGSFMGTEATITDIDAENGVVTVELLFFGRLSKVEIEFSDIDKI